MQKGRRGDCTRARELDKYNALLQLRKCSDGFPILVLRQAGAHRLEDKHGSGIYGLQWLFINRSFTKYKVPPWALYVAETRGEEEGEEEEEQEGGGGGERERSLLTLK